MAYVAGCALDSCGSVAEARLHLNQALLDARRAGDTLLELRVLNSLGAMHANQAQLEESRSHHEAALNLSRRLGDRTEESAALNGLGTVLVDLGHTHEAYDHYVAALERHDEQAIAGGSVAH